MTVAEAKKVYKANNGKPILPGTKEMTAMLVLATKCARNKS